MWCKNIRSFFNTKNISTALASAMQPIPGPMDIDDSIVAPASAASGDPENEIGGGGGRSQAGQMSGSEGIMPPPPSIPVSIVGSSIVGSIVDKGAAPEDSGEDPPGQKEVKLVPLPPGFGEFVLDIMYGMLVLPLGREILR